MKFLLSVSSLLFAAYTFGQQMNTDSMRNADKRKMELALNKPYQNFSFTTENGTVSNASLQGKVVLINFWHSKCAPCMAEMEALHNILDTFGTNPKFTMISFNFEDSKTVNKTKKKYAVKFPVYSINGDECDRLMYYLAFPTNIILNDSGVVVYISPGASLDKQRNIDYFQKKLFPLIKGELLKP